MTQSRTTPRARARRGCPPAALFLAALLACPSPARGADPLLVVLKNTLLGGTTGLVLGASLSLVVADEVRADVVRWATVAGSFAGFGIGVYLAARGEGELFGATSGAGSGSMPPREAIMSRTELLARFPEEYARAAGSPGARPGISLRLPLFHLAARAGASPGAPAPAAGRTSAARPAHPRVPFAVPPRSLCAQSLSGGSAIFTARTP